MFTYLAKFKWGQWLKLWPLWKWVTKTQCDADASLHTPFDPNKDTVTDTCNIENECDKRLW